MPSGQEILSSLYAAWRLLRGDVNALQYLNQSIAGFWRSFFAVVLTAPMLLIITVVHSEVFPAEEGEPEIGLAAGAVIRLISFVAAWLSFPLVMIWVSRMLGLGHRYVIYIIAWNWASVVAAAIMLLVTLVLASGMFSQGIAGALSIFAYGYILFYAYLVTKIGLACATGTAIGLVVFDALLEALVDLSVGSLLKTLV